MSLAVVTRRPEVPVGKSGNKRQALVVGVTAVAVLAAGYAAGGATNGSLAAALAVTVVAVPLIIWRSLRAGLVMIVVLALSVEQFKYDVSGTGLDAVTDRIPVFSSLSGITGVSGLKGNPIDLVVVILLIAWALTALDRRIPRLQRSRVGAAIGGLTAVALFAFVLGAARGGDVNVSSYELRPFLYVGAMFMLSTRLLPDARGAAALGWALVLSTGAKAIEGVIILVQVRNVQPPPESILGHEESFFFGLFIVVTAVLWLFRMRSRLRVVATTLLPVVIVADLGNARRVAWLILAADLVIIALLGWIALPERRRLIRNVVLVSVAGLALYLPAFWNASGLLAQPARAARSVVDPNVRDSSSDAYRYIEDADLGADIKNAGLLGTGMGLPIDYSKYPIADVSGADSFIEYIPHNGLLWVWMRAGPAGEVALWLVVATVVLASAGLVRSRDRLTGAIGLIGVCSAVQWVILGFSDMGFYWFRIAIVVGCIFGVVEACRRREAAATAAMDMAA